MFGSSRTSTGTAGSRDLGREMRGLVPLFFAERGGEVEDQLMKIEHWPMVLIVLFGVCKRYHSSPDRPKESPITPTPSVESNKPRVCSGGSTEMDLTPWSSLDAGPSTLVSLFEKVAMTQIGSKHSMIFISPRSPWNWFFIMCFSSNVRVSEHTTQLSLGLKRSRARMSNAIPHTFSCHRCHL